MTIGESWRWTSATGEVLSFVAEWNVTGRTGTAVETTATTLIDGPGDRLRSSRRTSRSLVFVARILGDGSTSATRSTSVRDQLRTWARVFAGDQGTGTLRITQPGGSFREIEGVPRLDVAERHGRSSQSGWQDVVVSLYCPDPDWLGAIRQTTLAPATSQTITNLGDLPTHVVATISGTADDFILFGSGRRFTFNGAVTSQLTVDMRPGARTVTDASGNRYAEVDQTGEMWALDTGDNLVTFSPSNPGAGSECVLTWRDRYAGV